MRDEEHADGTPNLPPRDRARVDAAKEIYAAGCRLIVVCITLGVRWSLEHWSKVLVYKLLADGSAAHTTFPRYLSLLHVWRATSQKDDYSHGGNGKLGSRPASRRSQKHPPGQKIHAWVTSWKRLADGFAAHTTLPRYLSLLHVWRATSQKDDHSHGGNGKLGV